MSKTTFYYLDGSTIIAEDRNGTMINYYYDNDEVVGMKYNGKYYYYVKDLFGNIYQIRDAEHKLVGEYEYDAWGNYTVTDNSSFIVYENPFRYRGYYMDIETEFYYLQTRYYDPAVRRFISSDNYELLPTLAEAGDLNLYTYCGNNPVMYTDPTGEMAGLLDNILAGLGVVIGTAMFVAAIIASAGTVGALAGVGAAALGFSTGAISSVITIATMATYVVAGGVALFGVSDAIEAFSGGYNPIRDYLMGGNQITYNIASGIFNVLGTIAVIAGTFGPKILQNVAKSGTAKISNNKIVGYTKDFVDRGGNWSFRIDATTHGNPVWHHNPHYHVIRRKGDGTGVYYLWEIINRWLS